LTVISRQEQVIFRWDDDDVHFVLEQHAELDFYSATSLKQQLAGRYVAPIILIQGFALTPYCCMLGGEATNTNFIVFFGLVRPGLKLAIYCTRGKHAKHYTTDTVYIFVDGGKLYIFYITFNR